MASLYVLGALVALGLYIVNYYRCFARNLAAAKQSNITYILCPIYTFNRFWLVTHRLWLPLFHMLPASWTETWIS